MLVARLYLAARVVVACLLVYVAWDTIKSFSEMAGGPRETIRELPPEGAPQPGPTSATQTDKPATPGTSVDDSRPVAGFRPDSRLGGLAGLGGIGGGWEFQGIPYKLHSEEVDAKSADARLLVPPDPAHLGGGTEDVDVEMLKVLMPRLKLQRVEADGWLQYRSEPGDFRVVAFCRKRGNRELFAAGRLMLKQEDGKARLLEVSPTPAVSGAGKAAASAAPVILPMPPGSTVFAVRRDSGREVLAEMVELPANSRAGLPRLWKSAGWLVEPLPGRSDTTEGAVCRLADDDGKGPLVTAWYLDVGGGKGDGLAVLTKMAGDAGGPKRP